MIDWHRVVRAERGGIGLDHRMQIQPLADLGQDRHAKLAAAVRDHEIDGLRRDSLGSADKIALVFAVFGVDDHHYFALADSLGRLFDGEKMTGHENLTRARYGIAVKTKPSYSDALVVSIIGVTRRPTNRVGQTCKRKGVMTKREYLRLAIEKTLAAVLAYLASAEIALAESNVDISAGVVFAQRDAGPLKADVFVPKGNGPFPGMLVVHGGAWMMGTREQLAGARIVPGRAWLRGCSDRLSPCTAGQMARSDLRLLCGRALDARARQRI